MMDWGYMGAGGAVMVVAMVVGLLLLVGLVAAAMGLLQPRRREASTPPATADSRSPAEIEVELRYARGEIDAATLAEQRAVLRQR